MVLGRTPIERAEIIALRDIRLTAAQAVVEAQAAVVAAQLAAAKVDLFNSSEHFLFPEATNEFCLLAAGNPANTFGAWVEITDNNGVTLSSKFAASPGYIREITLHIFSVANQKYIVEVRRGVGSVVGRIKCYSDWTYVLSMSSSRIPAGSTLSYRMMAETALATCRMDLRYIHG